VILYAQNASPGFALRITVNATHAIFGPSFYLMRRSIDPVVEAGPSEPRSRDDETPFPDLNTNPNIDDLFPKESVTKQIWRTLCEGIERWKNHRDIRTYQLGKVNR
jgi:hypothetical protein